MKYLTPFILLAAMAAAGIHAEEFGGIEFPQGAISFIDEMMSYEPDYSGGPVPTHENFTDPSEAIGVPDYSGGGSGTGSVSLGSGGRIVLRFTDNKLTGSDSPDPDLHIFEVGPDVEDTFVEISTDGTSWHSVGKVFGSTSSIDIDAYGFGSTDEFSYVRLTDDPDEGSNIGGTIGADIDAVGAISTTPAAPPLLIETAVLLKFQSSEGQTYTIQRSVDFETWVDVVPDIPGDGSVKKYCFEISGPRKYYRLILGD